MFQVHLRTSCQQVPTDSARRLLRAGAASPHGKKIRFKLGPGLETLKNLAGPFDLAFIDANKDDYSAYWDAVLPLVRPNGLVVVDNVLWSGRVLNPSEKSDQDIVAFNKKARADKRVELVMLTVRDGMLLARKLP